MLDHNTYVILPPEPKRAPWEAISAIASLLGTLLAVGVLAFHVTQGHANAAQPLVVYITVEGQVAPSRASLPSGNSSAVDGAADRDRPGLDASPDREALASAQRSAREDHARPAPAPADSSLGIGQPPLEH